MLKLLLNIFSTLMGTLILTAWERTQKKRIPYLTMASFLIRLPARKETNKIMAIIRKQRMRKNVMGDYVIISIGKGHERERLCHVTGSFREIIATPSIPCRALRPRFISIGTDNILR
jgi:hypothetical protein